MPNLIEFIWIWNQIQKLSIPRHHVKMARFLSDLWLKAEHKWGLLMAFRNSGKSTLVGLFCAWALFINPNVRILVLSADHGLAKKMVRNIKKILEQHPLTRSLIPEKKDEWASDRFTVCRTQNLRDPSVLGRGLLANMTGCRADIIICDDVEVPKTSDTSLKRRDLRQKLSELDYILTPGGLMLYIGTPHTRQTIYDTTSEGFLRDFHILKIPILNTKGQSNWPERFPLEQIQAIRVRSGPAKFLSQMMLEATSLEKARLNPDFIHFYTDELEYSECNGQAVLKLGKVALRSVSCFWDPSFASSEKQDNSVIACVFSDEAGHYYVHRILYLNVPQGCESATWQCQKVADFVRQYFIPAVHLETNGLGKFLPAVLRRIINQNRIPCAVLEEISKRNKAERILAAFDAPLANGALFMHESVKKTPFLEQMREWRENTSVKDDGLDAVAGCLLNEPVRLSRYIRPYREYKEWRF